MEQTELKEEKKDVSKEQRSRNMNLDEGEGGKQLNIKNLGSELTAVSHKNEQRQVAKDEVKYLVNQFALTDIKATNLLKKMTLKEAVKYLVYA